MTIDILLIIILMTTMRMIKGESSRRHKIIFGKFMSSTLKIMFLNEMTSSLLRFRLLLNLNADVFRRKVNND